MKKSRESTSAKPRWSRPLSKRWIVPGAALVLALALSATLFHFWIAKKVPADATIFGPWRTLKLDDFRVERAGAVFRLVGGGTTNLPDGARITIELRTTEVVFTTTSESHAGRLTVNPEDPRLVTNGSYQVHAVFRLEDQSQAMREALHYQPRSLEAVARLVVAGAADPAASVRPELAALIRKANAARAASDLRAVDAQADAFERRVWFSTTSPAIAKLRRSLAEALREQPAGPDWEKLRRDLVEADFLASL